MLAPLPNLADLGGFAGDINLSGVVNQLLGIGAALEDVGQRMREFSSSLEFAADHYDQAEMRALSGANVDADFVSRHLGYFRADRVERLLSWAGEWLEPKLSEWDWNLRSILAGAVAMNSEGDFRHNRNYMMMALAVDRSLRMHNADTPLERSAVFLTNLYPAVEKISGTYKSTLKMQRSNGASPALFWRRSAYRWGLDGFNVRTSASFSAPVERQLGSTPPMLKTVWPSMGALPYPQLPGSAGMPGTDSKPRSITRAVATPTKASDLVSRVKDLRYNPQGVGADGPDSTHGEFEVLRHDNGGRRPSWSVIVRGTQQWTPGAPNPKDMQANLELVAGVPADEQSAIMAALELEGAEPGDAVELAGHSQGGLVAGAMAANRTFADRYNVAAVVTAGSPISGMSIPQSTPVLSFENADDIVPALDGEPPKTSRNHISVYSQGRGEASHSLSGYEADALAAEEFTNSDLQRWNEKRIRTMGFSEDSKTTRQRYTITRVKG